jgi:hypothetical protein
MRHQLKTWPEYFQAVWNEEKTFEVRKNDRNFQVGDALVLQEYDPATESYTGSGMVKTVTYILDNPAFVKEGFVVMGLGEYMPWQDIVTTEST